MFFLSIFIYYKAYNIVNNYKFKIYSYEIFIIALGS